ncbi:HAMP domain-containing sensor histidine kinase [Nonomuraea antimicrobica]|uniref:histidine kinase n=1 Tax=Nonomuraea antimicrobica TaxID=561173 RepID=A0ABP7B7E2_9ACTN
MLILVPTAVAVSVIVSQTISDVMWEATQQQVVLVAAAVRKGALSSRIVPSVPGVDLVQVVEPNGHVLAASDHAGRTAPMVSARPSGDGIQDLQTCTGGKLGCLRVSALRVNPGDGSPLVYAAARTAVMTSTTMDDTILAVQAALLAAAVGGITWYVTGRMLRPVEAIRSELATTTLSDLSHRIAQPSGNDEIAKLIRTLNHTLLRLERATHAQRRFVADASHELRTPLAGLRLKLEEAEMHPQDIDVGELIHEGLYDIDRLQAITTDLLLLTGLESSAAGARETIDLADLSYTELSRRADPIPVTPSLLGGVIVEAVPGQLGRVLTNLLDNAQRYARGRVELRVSRDGTYAIMAVSDDGPGVPVADRERVFERFTRLDAARSRDHGGTGLGLAIADDIVRAHSGTITIRDSAHGGACFEVRLPLSSPGAGHGR